MPTTQEIYKKKTRKSSKLFAKAKKVHINGVHHNIRFFEPYPFVTKSADGKFLRDVDSNKYVDFIQKSEPALVKQRLLFSETRNDKQHHDKYEMLPLLSLKFPLQNLHSSCKQFLCK